jgi:hypothetical protein
MTQTWEPAPPPSQRVECPASREPAVKRVILAALFLGFGIWCLLDRGKYAAPDDWSMKNINGVAGYVLNNWAPWVMLPLGTALLLWAGLGLRKRLEADEEGIGYVGRERIAWSEVDKLDGSRLQSKGVVAVHAGSRRLVLDSYYLSNFHELMTLVEQQVPAEKQVLK